MNEDFVPFELLCKLRNKGYYCKQARYEGHIHDVLKWLRDERKLHVHIEYVFSETTEYDCEIQIINSYERFYPDGDFDTYEQAAIAGIEYVLDNLI